jgi:hypothetical protein
MHAIVQLAAKQQKNRPKAVYPQSTVGEPKDGESKQATKIDNYSTAIKMTRYSLFARKLATVLLLLFSAEQVSGSVHWDGPVDAAITLLATFLNDHGVEGAGVRPFGYGFTIGEVVPKEAPVAAEVGKAP